MEALLMSCRTGGGHHAAAYAVKEELERRGHHVTFLDPYTLVGEKLSEKVGSTYIRLVQKSPQTFGFVYALGEGYRHLPIHSPVYWANGKMAASMQRYLKKHHFDVILMTHMYPAHILSHVRKRMDLPPTYLIATDYTCIPFMEETACDHYVIPSEELAEEFAGRGIPQEKLLPFGIPVRKKFGEKTSKKELEEKLKRNPDQPFFLLSGGSIGAGKIKKTVKVLEDYLNTNEKCSLLVICGNNQKLYDSLHKKYQGNSRITIRQSTKHMAEYVKICDVFLSKPGGLSSTEAAVAETLLIHLSPIPGCESHNVRFFQKHGMSILVSRPERELIPALKRMEDSAFGHQMKLAQKRFVNCRAAEMLCDFVEEEQKGQRLDV